MLGVGLGCCCGDCTGLCGDIRNVTFLADLSGFADGSGAPASCAACSTFNTSFVLTYSESSTATIPWTPCAFDEGAPGTVCYYVNRTVCDADDPFAADLIIDVTLAVYLSASDNWRGHLQVTVSGTALDVVSKNFLLGTGSGSITCLDVSVSDTFDVCTSTGTNYCTPATAFILTAVEA